MTADLSPLHAFPIGRTYATAAAATNKTTATPITTTTIHKKKLRKTINISQSGAL